MCEQRLSIIFASKTFVFLNCQVMNICEKSYKVTNGFEKNVNNFM